VRPVPDILAALPTATAAATLLLVVPYAIFAVGLPLAWDAPWLIAGFAFLVGGGVASAGISRAGSSGWSNSGHGHRRSSRS